MIISTFADAGWSLPDAVRFYIVEITRQLMEENQTLCLIGPENFPQDESDRKLLTDALEKVDIRCQVWQSETSGLFWMFADLGLRSIIGRLARGEIDEVVNDALAEAA